MLNDNRFGFAPQALLAVIACVVHYDLFDLFLMHPYGRRGGASDDERQPTRRRRPEQDVPERDHRQRPVYDGEPVTPFDSVLVPGPGTDPYVANTLLRRPTIVVDDYGDRGDRRHYWMDDDYWTVDADADANGWIDIQTSDDDHDDKSGVDCGGGDTVDEHTAAAAAAGSTAGPPSPVPSSFDYDDGDDDGYEYDEDYTAPGEERDEDIF